MTRLLVIEDNPDHPSGLVGPLRMGGYESVVVYGARHGLDVGLGQPRPDLIILDLVPCAPSGFQVLRLLREGGYDGPVLAVSQSANEADKVQGFRLGADQYMTKPCGALEFLARVDSLLNRARARNGWQTVQERPPHHYEFGHVKVEPTTHQVRRKGETVKLAPLEFELLMALLRRRGATATRGELLREVWRYGPDVTSRTLDTHILHLREKLEDDPSAPCHILTVRKQGYRLQL